MFVIKWSEQSKYAYHLLWAYEQQLGNTSDNVWPFFVKHCTSVFPLVSWYVSFEQQPKLVMEPRSLICLMYCVSFSLTVCKNITGPGVCMQPNRLVYALIELNSYQRTFLQNQTLNICKHEHERQSNNVWNKSA